MMSAAIDNPQFWPRAIILVDMNAFFASVEQQLNPEWKGRPVAVTNGEQGTCIITCSYEARAYGIYTGMRLKQAYQLCPGLIQAPSRPHNYVKVSTAIMESLKSITPDLEVYSVDEAFLDVTKCQKLHGTPIEIAYRVKRVVEKASGGLHCSIGVSGDKTTAKYAAKYQKPNGLTVIPPWEAREWLHDVPLTDLWGIGKGIGKFLEKHGVITCGDMQKLPISVLGQRFGNPGKRIWYQAQGLDPEKVHTTVPDPKSIGHGKVMPPNTLDRETIHVYLLHMSQKVVARLRRYGLYATRFMMGVRSNHQWIGNVFHHSTPTHDIHPLKRFISLLLNEIWQGEPVSAVQVTAIDPRSSTQMDLFSEDENDFEPTNQAIDAINTRFGEMTITSARLLARSSMPNVIAPSWKPSGHRQTI